MLFPQVYLFFLAGSLQVSFCSALPSHFIYCLPCYPTLSIFNQVSNLIDLILYLFCLFFMVYISQFILCLKFQGICIGWVPPIAFGSGFHVCMLFFFFFFLITNVSHGTLGLALCLVGMHFAATSKWELIKFSFVIRSRCFWYLLKCTEFVS